MKIFPSFDGKINELLCLGSELSFTHEFYDNFNMKVSQNFLVKICICVEIDTFSRQNGSLIFLQMEAKVLSFSILQLRFKYF